MSVAALSSNSHTRRRAVRGACGSDCRLAAHAFRKASRRTWMSVVQQTRPRADVGDIVQRTRPRADACAHSYDGHPCPSQLPSSNSHMRTRAVRGACGSDCRVAAHDFRKASRRTWMSVVQQDTTGADAVQHWYLTDRLRALVRRTSMSVAALSSNSHSRTRAVRGACGSDCRLAAHAFRKASRRTWMSVVQQTRPADAGTVRRTDLAVPCAHSYDGHPCPSQRRRATPTCEHVLCAEHAAVTAVWQHTILGRRPDGHGCPSYSGHDLRRQRDAWPRTLSYDGHPCPSQSRRATRTREHVLCAEHAEVTAVWHHTI